MAVRQHTVFEEGGSGESSGRGLSLSVFGLGKETMGRIVQARTGVAGKSSLIFHVLITVSFKIALWFFFFSNAIELFNLSMLCYRCYKAVSPSGTSSKKLSYLRKAPCYLSQLPQNRPP